MTPADNFSDTLVARLVKQGVEPVAYVVNDIKYAKKLKAMGVRFLMTDNLSLLRKSLVP